MFWQTQQWQLMSSTMDTMTVCQTMTRLTTNPIVSSTNSVSRIQSLKSSNHLISFTIVKNLVSTIIMWLWWMFKHMALWLLEFWNFSLWAKNAFEKLVFQLTELINIVYFPQNFPLFWAKLISRFLTARTLLSTPRFCGCRKNWVFGLRKIDEI